ncbi:MAG TPA: amidohydrolase family protein [Stellaceae bacterium]|nr:amidohydrolase family protein [Stellaceae bacterium]
MDGPVPNPRKPKFAPPPGACDTHCHVYGPGTRLVDCTAERLFALHRHLGIERAVIVQADRTLRAATLAAMAAGGGRYRGVALVDDNDMDKDLEALHRAGVRGVRFTFVSHLGGAPDLVMVRRTLLRIKPLGWHVTFLIDPADMLINLGLLQAITIPCIIDHMARVKADEGLNQAGFKALLDLVRRDNFWAKLSGPDRISEAGPPFHDAVPYARALIDAAPDRVIWGTDWPHPNNRFDPDDGDLVDLLPLIAPDAAARRKLLVDNPARLYGFAP